MGSSLATKTPPAAGAEVVHHLNIALKYALTGINQHFLHARMLKHAGLMKLADREYKESIDTMRHADRLVERVLNLGGVPNLQELGHLHIGSAPEDMLHGNLKLAEQTLGLLETSVALCETSGDEASATLLKGIRTGMGEHATFLRQQLELMASLGTEAYLRTQA